MIVEDDFNLSIELVSQLELQGYRTRTVPFKSATIAYLSELKPVLIVLDILQINEKNGWTLLEALKNAPTISSIPAIVFSGLDLGDMALRKGAAAFVTKPLNETLLVSEVKRLVETMRVHEVVNGE